MVAWLDENQCLHYANPAWLAWFDHADLSQVLGKPLASICGAPWVQRYSTSFATATRSGSCSFDTEKYDVFDVVRWARVHLSCAQAADTLVPDGQPAMLMVMRETMSDLEGKVACEAFTRDETSGEITAAATLDGERAPEYDSRFRLLDPDARVKLRGVFEDKPDPTTT